jgi:hypothetical protein
MDVAWQDGVGSFLDSSGTDPSGFISLANGDGGTLWSSSGDSSQSILWESGPDSAADSHISGFTSDSAGATDTGTLLAGTWITDAASGFAGASTSLNDGVLWTSAGSDTSTSLASNGGVGLGALDLGATSGASQWQQFVDQFAGGSAAGLTDTPHLLWTSASSQPPISTPVAAGSQPLHIDPNDSFGLAPVASGSQPLHIDPNGSLGLPTLGIVSPAQPIAAGSQRLHIDPNDSFGLPTLGSVSSAQLVWTQPSSSPWSSLSEASASLTNSLGGSVQAPSGLPSIGSTR